MTRALAALLLLGLAGCGTLRDLTGHSPLETPGPHVYGGVRTSLELAKTPFCCSGTMAIFFLPDVPFSAILDTVLLPVTGPWALIRGTP